MGQTECATMQLKNHPICNWVRVGKGSQQDKRSPWSEYFMQYLGNVNMIFTLFFFSGFVWERDKLKSLGTQRGLYYLFWETPVHEWHVMKKCFIGKIWNTCFLLSGIYLFILQDIWVTYNYFININCLWVVYLLRYFKIISIGHLLHK